MNVHCPQCRSTYRVDPDRVPPGGVRARCSRCGWIMPVARPGVAAPAAQPAAGLAAATTAAPALRTPPDAAPLAVTPAERVGAAAVAGPAAPPFAASHVPAEPARPEPSTGPSTPVGRELAAAAPPAGSGASARPPAVGTDRSGGLSRRAAVTDPDARARRIARALVSDIVVYNRERCERSLQEGTLRTEFKDEILKSWEEYVQQVGLEMARSTPYFRDALNEILAKGQKVF
nr:MAG: hypothetical protein DIU52_03205 [bacterium]